MEKLLQHRSADIHDTLDDNKNLKEELAAFTSTSDVPQERIHIENMNEHGRRYRESSIHNNVMIDCARHRPNGYKDHTWVNRIPDEFIDEFGARRTNDRVRDQNIVNRRFPSLAEARD